MNRETFLRISTDKQREVTTLKNSYASAAGASCFIVGAGPSLAEVNVGALLNSPAPRFCINLAGTGLFRPQLWTAYDPTQRFSRSTYLDPGVMKLVSARRAFDLIPETTWKVCDCPNVYFFEGDRDRGFANFLDARHSTIVDWNDSLVQAIDLAYQLGFRTLYLLGCEMKVQPGAELRTFAETHGLPVPDGAGLHEILSQWDKRGFGRNKRSEISPGGIYHFDEMKTLEAAGSTDFHYFRIAQFLRLSRRALSLAGVRLVSVTPESRLNEFFPYCRLADALSEIEESCGSPQAESTRGRYTATSGRMHPAAKRMRDFQPLHWSSEKKKRGTSSTPEKSRSLTRAEQLQQAEIIIEEEG